jgi:hypothetical protein
MQNRNQFLSCYLPVLMLRQRWRKLHDLLSANLPLLSFGSRRILHGVTRIAMDGRRTRAAASRRCPRTTRACCRRGRRRAPTYVSGSAGPAAPATRRRARQSERPSPERRKTKHDLHNIATESVRDRRAACARHGPKTVLNLRRECVCLGHDLKEFRVLLHVTGLCDSPVRKHPRPLLQIMGFERRRREDAFSIERKGEEPHDPDET